jgi:asparagine synthase (glutamine-hydrolysing)
MTRVAEGFGVLLVQPLLDPGFVGALTDHVGRVGRASRADLMTELFGDLLPTDLTERTSKARFDDVFWTDHAAAAVASMTVDALSDYVDEEALRGLWRSDGPKGNTYLIAKYLWQLESARRGAATTGVPPQPAD